MRITLLHPYLWPEVRRGAERYLDDLSGYLARRDHDVTVVTGTRGRPAAERRGDGVRVVRVPMTRRGAGRLGLSETDIFGLTALPALLWRGADVVHALVPAAALAGRAARRPTLYTVLGHPAADQMPSAAAPRRLFAAAVARSTTTAVLSRASAAALEASSGRAPIVLPPGIRSEQFPPDTGPRRGAPVVLFSASLADPRKRATLALDAFALLRRRRPDARLLLSGQGDPAPLLRGAPHSVTEGVEVLGAGRPDEVAGRYRRATVTLLPAAHEAFGLALVESLATGTPVVCTPDGGMPEIVEPAVGRVAASASAADLSRALDEAIDLAADPCTPGRCVTRARAWDWDGAVGPAHEAVYAQLRRSPGGARTPPR